MLAFHTKQALSRLSAGTDVTLYATICDCALFGFTEVDLDRRRFQLARRSATNQGSDIQSNLFVLAFQTSEQAFRLVENSRVTYEFFSPDSPRKKCTSYPRRHPDN